MQGMSSNWPRRLVQNQPSPCDQTHPAQSSGRGPRRAQCGTSRRTVQSWRLMTSRSSGGYDKQRHKSRMGSLVAPAQGGRKMMNMMLVQMIVIMASMMVILMVDVMLKMMSMI